MESVRKTEYTFFSQEKYDENLSLISSIMLRKLRLRKNNGFLVKKHVSMGYDFGRFLPEAFEHCNSLYVICCIALFTF